jgi:hypothetical protein
MITTSARASVRFAPRYHFRFVTLDIDLDNQNRAVGQTEMYPNLSSEQAATPIHSWPEWSGGRDWRPCNDTSRRIHIAR